MLTNEAIKAAVELYDLGSTHFCVQEETGISREEAELVAQFYDAGETEQLYREVALAGVLEITARTLRRGEGVDEIALDDLLREIRYVFLKKFSHAPQWVFKRLAPRD